jgi:integrase
MSRSAPTRKSDPVSALLALRMQARGFPRGWSVSPYRGRARLRVTPGAGDGKQRQVLMGWPWSAAHAEEIAAAVLAAREAFQAGMPLEEALSRHVSGNNPEQQQPDSWEDIKNPEPPEIRSPEGSINWAGLIETYRLRKISSGELKSSTWDKIWRPRMGEVLAAIQKQPPPSQSRQLLEAVTLRWAEQPGARGRQMQVQQTAALLRWAVDEEWLPDCWAPPLDLTPYVGRKRAELNPTTPMEVPHILEMVEDIPDPRWQLAFQLMAAYGLRPEELRHLERRGEQLHCSYRKVTSRGSTAPRNLRLLPCDEWAAGWDLLNRFDPDRMPPLRAGESGEALATYLKRRRKWQELRNSYAANAEKLVPYSLRHAYAHRAHVVLGLAPKVAAALMGHSVQTHLAAYSRWCGDDVVDAALARAGMHWQTAKA